MSILIGSWASLLCLATPLFLFQPVFPLDVTSAAVGGLGVHSRVFERQAMPAVNSVIIRSRVYHVPAAPPTPLVEVPGGIVESCGGLEKRCRKVKVDPFRLEKTEVTVAQFAGCIQAGACHSRHLQVYDDTPFCNLGSPDDRTNHPVNCAGFFAAREYCRWIGRRLPTLYEMQWAMRGPEERTYPWGNEEPTCARATFHGKEGRGCGSDYTSPVGTHPDGASPLGIFDLAGNVMEWTSTIHDLPDDDPEGKTIPVADNRRTYHNQMGGSFADAPHVMAADFLCMDKAKTINISLGFRCAE